MAYGYRMRTAETEQGNHGREVQTSVGRVVKALMALTGTNQADLAEWLHMDASIVSKMLTGARKMTVDDLVAIAGFFPDTSPADLLADPEELLRTRSFSTPELALIQGSGDGAPTEPTPRTRHLTPVH